MSSLSSESSSESSDPSGTNASRYCSEGAFVPDGSELSEELSEEREDMGVPGAHRWVVGGRDVVAGQPTFCRTQSWNSPMWCSLGTSTPPRA